MGRIKIVVGGQFGSEGKGAIAARLARNVVGLTAIRVAGPNAGHTVIGDRGIDTSDTIAPNLCTLVGSTAPEDHPAWPDAGGRFAWRLRHVPVAAVTNPHAVLILSAGSEIDLEVLTNEVTSLDKAGYAVSSRLFVDPEATIIDERHQHAERFGRHWDCSPHDDIRVGQGIADRIGSTGKGIGAARADRIWRVEGIRLGDQRVRAHQAGRLGTVTDTQPIIAAALAATTGEVHIEGTQGYGLGLHAGYYPTCTSSDCRAIDFLAMAGVNPWASRLSIEVWLCLRVYPIRVGGASGPMFSERSWEELGLNPELTTVTGKVRRVGEWDQVLALRALRANGGPSPHVKVALTMFDQVCPAIAGHDDPYWLNGPGDEANQARLQVLGYERSLGAQVSLLGTGPDTAIDLDLSSLPVPTAPIADNGPIESPVAQGPGPYVRSGS